MVAVQAPLLGIACKLCLLITVILTTPLGFPENPTLLNYCSTPHVSKATYSSVNPRRRIDLRLHNNQQLKAPHKRIFDRYASLCSSSYKIVLNDVNKCEYEFDKKNDQWLDLEQTQLNNRSLALEAAEPKLISRCDPFPYLYHIEDENYLIVD